MKRSHRRITALALAASAALALGACSSGGGTGADSGSGAGGADGAGEKGALAMSFAGLDIEFWNDMIPIMEGIVTDAGYEFITHDPKWNAQTQVQDWESWTVRGDVRAIMGYPVQSDAMVSVTQQAQDAGIPVLGYGSEWDGVTAAVLFDHYRDGLTAGERAAEWIEQTYGDERVEVALLAWPDTDLGRLRGDGLRDALEESGLNVNLTEHKTLSLDDGYAAAQNQLTAVPNTKVWLAVANNTASGAYQAIIDSGVSPTDDSMLLLNLDATDAELEIVMEEGSFWRYIFTSPLRYLAETNAQMLIDAAEGKPVENEVVPVTEVTAANASEHLLENQLAQN